MLNKLFIILLGVLLTPMMLFGEIKQVSSMKEIQSYFDESTNDQLGIFDIDETLTLPFVQDKI